MSDEEFEERKAERQAQEKPRTFFPKELWYFSPKPQNLGLKCYHSMQGFEFLDNSKNNY